ncbi:MAG: hypothetical protein QOG04_2181 [Actinomycetota bacterium]|nr:hypothetical protein [Actinomycetota bacterium]
MRLSRAERQINTVNGLSSGYPPNVVDGTQLRGCYFFPFELSLPWTWDKVLAAADFSSLVDFGLASTLPAALAAFLPVVLLCAICSSCLGSPDKALGSKLGER